MTLQRALALAGISLLAIPGCKNDNELRLRDFDAIAVVSGDFDYMESTLDRLLVPFQVYEGYTDSPSYEFDGDPDDILLTAEGLFTGSTDSGRELDVYDAVFVNSGVRGLGAYVYNSTAVDDAFVADPDVIAAIQDYVGSGGVLVVSDWGYDLIEAAWPDKIEFYNNDAIYDDAQVGAAQSVEAQVVDTELEAAIGGAAVTLDYNFSNWAAIESVSDEVEVHVRGDVEVRLSASEGYGQLSDSPLLVSFNDGGDVYFSSFHWNAQTGPLAGAMMEALVERLPVDSSEDEGTADTGASE